MSLEQFLLLLNPGFVELEDAALGNPFVPAAENKMYLGSLSNSLREHEAPQSDENSSQKKIKTHKKSEYCNQNFWKSLHMFITAINNCIVFVNPFL